MEESKHKLKVNALARLLELIEEVNKDIEAIQLAESEVLKKEYLYLKLDYTQQLLELLKDYDLPLQVEEAA